MSSKVEVVLSSLLGDFERQNGKLKEYQVERLLNKRDLTAEERLLVYEGLAAHGIELEIDEKEVVKKESKEDEDDEDDTEVSGLQFIDIITAIIHGAKKTPLLNHDDEIKYGAAIANGIKMEKAISAKEIKGSAVTQNIIDRGRAARVKFIQANMRLVINLAKQYKEITELDFSDLIQEGMMGLMKAVERYDHTKGFRFSTYATYWIEQTITRALSDQGDMIRIPVYMNEKIIKLRRVRRMLEEQHFEREIGIREIAKELGWKLEETNFIHQVSQLRCVSMDAPAGDDGAKVMDFIESAPTSTKELLDEGQLAKLIDEIFKGLTAREVTVIKNRFGLNDSKEPKTLEELGKMFDVTRERIRQIEARALKKLRHPTRSKKLVTFYGHTLGGAAVLKSKKANGKKK